jgi:hypothetical protein
LATKNVKPPLEIYQIKVTLRDITPPIWRRLLVPADITLAKLHDVLQIAMGWTDSHLHEFLIGKERFGTPDPEDRLMGLPQTVNERKVKLCDMLGGVGAKALYTYDFGDGWEHNVVVEKVLPPEPGLTYPICTAGKRQAPPEDCGGTPGYYRLLEVLADPADEEHEEMLEWVGDGFAPEAFSLDDINEGLSSLQKRRTTA